MPKVNKGKVITITSMKGGVGKTIFTLALATALKKEDKKVLIVDLDLYNGNIAFSLNLNIKATIYNICDDVANNRYKSDLLSEYIIKYDDNIDIISSPKDPRQASKIDGRYLDIMLRSFVNKYDVVLIDTNHILDVTNMIAFECSNTILDLFTNDAFDIKNTKNFASICKNMKVDNVKFVLNNSFCDRKKYFNEYEIESLIKEEISYIVPKNFYIKNIDKYIVDGKTLDVLEKLVKANSNNQDSLCYFALSLLDDNRKGDNNEKE